VSGEFLRGLVSVFRQRCDHCACSSFDEWTVSRKPTKGRVRISRHLAVLSSGDALGTASAITRLKVCYMSVIQFTLQTLRSNNFDGQKSFGMAAAVRGCGLGARLTDAESGAAMPGLCSRHCVGPRNPRSSRAEYPNVFCSAGYEQKFIRTALDSVSTEDCVRIHRLLECLLSSAETNCIVSRRENAGAFEASLPRLGVEPIRVADGRLQCREGGQNGGR
jgi:hypothetical protein